MVRPRRVSHFAGVLGWPLQSTLSPAIHNAAFRKLGLDWVYLRWPVPPDSLGAAVAGLRALGATGANVTIPHKEQIKTHLDECSGDALAIGAVNTIQRVGDLLVGHNTDVDGFTEFIASDVGFDARGTRALVLGAGGARRDRERNASGGYRRRPRSRRSAAPGPARCGPRLRPTDNAAARARPLGRRRCLGRARHAGASSSRVVPDLDRHVRPPRGDVGRSSSRARFANSWA
jgi:hypothetical protein